MSILKITLEPVEASTLARYARRYALYATHPNKKYQASNVAEKLGFHGFDTHTHTITREQRTALLDVIHDARGNRNISTTDDHALQKIHEKLAVPLQAKIYVNSSQGDIWLPLDAADAAFLADVALKWRQFHTYEIVAYAEHNINLTSLVQFLLRHSKSDNTEPLRLSVRYAELFERILTDCVSWQNTPMFRALVRHVGAKISERLIPFRPSVTLSSTDATLVRRALHQLAMDPTNGVEYRRISNELTRQLTEPAALRDTISENPYPQPEE